MADENFCKDYLVLKPEEASPLDCIRILYSSALQKRNFFNAPEEATVRGFRHRWIIFVSVVMQKLFLWLKGPVAKIGSLLELWLNYPSCNGGYCTLFLNLLTGRLVRPDNSSPNFRSIVGNLDTRVELDGSIKNGDNRYIPSLAMMASKLSYENKAFVQNVIRDKWQMKFMEFYNFWNDYEEMDTAQAIMFEDTSTGNNLIVVAFRGTGPFDTNAWRTDVDISWYEFPGIGKIHGGFLKALGLQKNEGWPEKIQLNSNQKLFAYYTIREHLKTLIHDNKNAKFILTGHSLGGALAILFVAILTMHGEEMLLDRLEGVYTFGQPRVGNKQFGDYMKEKLREFKVKYLRYVYCNDIVPRLPYDDKTFLFKHFGACLYFNSCYKGQFREEEPNKNYFSFLYILPKILNAVFELIRSLILPWRKGLEYKEGWFMKIFRIAALVLPGLVDHFPQDYNNSTRLGNLPPNEYLKKD
ncbi:uncharacterized protein LOC111367420 isoform X2 [Olea europaea subsp. europaea]|uniref:Uncharacterized protein LOC111367420 isoform X2 n=1 Tax=Olea europaea subsp. europaea TaxID=158383 RepID=A0A8S0SUU1_OLEEU|nr:uncharacterized protein LOC111367420 isoform X2 [Olea europaea subsp. europaea]